MTSTLENLDNMYPDENALILELKKFSKLILETKHDVAQIKIDIDSVFQVDSVHDELDAVILATAQATDIILECAEKLEELKPLLTEETSAQLNDQVTRIYEACTFQDITGQRISKVIKLLLFIESELKRILKSTPETHAVPKKEVLNISGHNELANGPQLPREAFHQDDIDALFSN